MTSSRRSTRGRMAQEAPEAHPREGIDIPCGLPPEAYLSRCGGGGEEMVVKEAIMDVAVGVATFQGESRGGRPTMGCPGCHGETMEDVAQKP